MQINTVQGYDPTTSNIYTFKGLNRLRRGYTGEFEDMVNMSTDEYPCAAPRGRRATAATAPGEIQAAAAPDTQYTDKVAAFTGIAGGGFYYDGELKSGNAVLSLDMNWTIVRFVNLYVMNGYNSDTREHAIYSYNIDTEEFAFFDSAMDLLCVTSGTDSTGDYLATFRYNYDAFYDYNVTGKDGTVLRGADFFSRYGATPGKWTLSADENIFEYKDGVSEYSQKFKIGDEVMISGFPDSQHSVGQCFYYYTREEEIVPVTDKDYDLNNTFDSDTIRTLDDVSDRTICNAYVKGFAIHKGTAIADTGIQTQIHYLYLDLRNKNGETVHFQEMKNGDFSVYCLGISVAKKYHKFDTIAIHNNRVWGTLPNGKEIFASTSDDPFDYFSQSLLYETPLYVRLVSDRPGRFTGLCEFNSDLIAFKESSFTIIMGDEIGNYTQSVTSGIGCIDPRSIIVTPGGVIFLSYNGFYAYTGSGAPSLLSTKLNHKYVSAVAGYDGNCYYAFSTDRDGNRQLLVYDFRYNTWHIQDNIHNGDIGDFIDVSGFFRFKGDFFIADKTTRRIYRCNADDVKDLSEGEISWSFTTARSYTNALDSKAITDLWIRADIDEHAWFRVETSADARRFVTHNIFGKTLSGEHVLHVPVLIDVGSTYRIRLSGSGKVVIYEIETNLSRHGRVFKDPEPEISKTKTDKLAWRY